MKAYAPAFAVIALGLTAACARPKPAVVVPAPVVDVQPQLRNAEALVLVGCFDCLTEALADFEAIRAMPNVSRADVDVATIGSIRTAALLELRERELSTTDDGYLKRAKELLSARDDLMTGFGPLLEVLDSIPWRDARTGDGALDPAASNRRLQALRVNVETLSAERRAHADDDALAAYVWVAFSCTHGDREARSRDSLLAPLHRFRDVPLVSYAVALCGAIDVQNIEALQRREPRFEEINYWLGAAAIGGLKIDEAERYLMAAYEWRPRWPAATVALGNIYVTAEDFAAALTFYDRTLAVMPGHGDAAMGRVRALSYLGRHDDAFVAIDPILSGAIRAFAGEAYYWRAWNNLQTGRLDPAWDDIQEATRLWVNSEVPKLAGIVAYRRRELDEAQVRFEAARKLSREDCESAYYLGIVHAERRHWPDTADVFVSAARCLESAQRGYGQDIERIQASSAPFERKARLIAAREQKIATAGRMLATSWFNTAVAYYNLSRKDDAKRLAEKLTDDEQFGVRATELLSWLR